HFQAEILQLSGKRSHEPRFRGRTSGQTAMNSSIVEILHNFTPAVSILAIVLGTFIAAFRIYLQYKTEVAKKEPEQDAFRVEHAPKSLDNLSELLVQNFRILNSFYSENLSQYRTSSIASISIAVLGFVVILAGVLIALIGNQVALGSISSAAGIV